MDYPHARALFIEIEDIVNAWMPHPGDADAAYKSMYPPPMVEAMHRAYERFPAVETAMRGPDSAPVKQAFLAALDLYMGRLVAFYETCEEYPTKIALPKAVNDRQTCAWMFIEGFLHQKTGKKPAMSASN